MRQWRCLTCRTQIRHISTVTSPKSLDEALPGRLSNLQDLPPDQAIPRPLAKSILKLKPHKPPPADNERIRASRHLLRHFLRECTYLPDPYTREWLKEHIRQRFERYSVRDSEIRKATLQFPVTARAPNSKRDKWEARLNTVIRQARTYLARVRRANEGDRGNLLKLMYMAYGRMGKRRYELLQPMMRAKAAPVDDAEATERPSYALSPSIIALLKSQISAAPPTVFGPNPKRLEPAIEPRNEWGRPMPWKRVVNKTKAHYAMNLDRLHLPLPEDEWHRLFDLASGRRPAPPAIPRRGKVAVEERPSPLEIMLRHEKAPKYAFENRDAHSITPRFMQRLYAEILVVTPMMQWDVDKKDWKFTWGHHVLHSANVNPMREAKKAV